MTGRPDLYIFDFDGTLADSAGWFRSILPDIAKRFGFRCPGAEELEELRHKPPREVMRVLKIPGWKLVFIAVHVRKRAAREGHFPIFEGVPEVLEAIKAKGAKIAIVSSNAEASVRRALGPELAVKVDAFSCGAGMFGKAKHFRDVLAKLGVPAERALAVGDEIRDIDAAREVGLKAAAVGWGFAMQPALEAAGPDHCFGSVADFRAFVVGG
ncbi:MAG TPA: HAD hydrolase-like protein [Hyphomonas sp.]|nr:HAD hydrolase-like protein [Hyphomonas sp.]HRK68295.1 HAD hydrolase-like protein [Hyphomonas sp.]